MPLPTQGAFFGRNDLYLQTVAMLDNLPDRRFIQKQWRKQVTRPKVLQVLLPRPADDDLCGCLFYHLTGLADDTKVFHEARRRYNFPLAFSEVLMALYDNHPGKPGPLAREMLRAIKPGTNLNLATRQYGAGHKSDKTWPMLKHLLEACASSQKLAA
jgi:hypothetical protein